MTTPVWRRLSDVFVAFGIGALLAGAVWGALAAAEATDRASFCRSACHEMTPYHSAWSQGPHRSVECVECHVASGAMARLSHKFVALREVKVHVLGSPMFPLPDPAPIPDERCRACHRVVDPLVRGFDHEAHRHGRPCVDCHATVGHEVPLAALRSAGVLRSDASTETTGIARAGQNGAGSLIERHEPVSCSRCHRMPAMGCGACHEPRHTALKAKTPGECADCHAPGPAFIFDHPTERRCSSCHEAPEKGHPTKGACAACHRQAGESWAFKHPKGGSCASCHERPKGHRSGACSSCHPRTGASWAFAHPDSGTCSSCHSRPKGHRSGVCSSCHRAGSSWAYRHPASSRCSSCHSAPRKHFGSSCASCHRSNRSWSRASFSHPRIRGGEHSYRSFACSKCHPNGYSSSSCSRCHSSSRGPSEDEDDD